jgi:hypothetical protein
VSAPILPRIDAALQKMAFRQMDVRAIYLTSADHEQFDREMCRRFRLKGSFLAYGDHQIRRGNTSRIYSTHGVNVDISVEHSGPSTRAA